MIWNIRKISTLITTKQILFISYHFLIGDHKVLFFSYSSYSLLDVDCGWDKIFISTCECIAIKYSCTQSSFEDVVFVHLSTALSTTLQFKFNMYNFASRGVFVCLSCLSEFFSDAFSLKVIPGTCPFPLRSVDWVQCWYSCDYDLLFKKVTFILDLWSFCNKSFYFLSSLDTECNVWY